jgi:hypothetical protein
MYLISPHFSSFHDGDCIAAEVYWQQLVGEKDGLTRAQAQAQALSLGTEYII